MSREVLMFEQEDGGVYHVIDTFKTISLRYWAKDSTWSNPGKEIVLVDAINSTVLSQDSDSIFPLWIMARYLEKYYGNKGWIGKHLFAEIVSDS